MPAITDSMLRTWGGLELPAEAGDLSENALTSLDPGRDVLLALFASAINSELGEAWTAAVATLPSTHPLYGTQPVEDTLPFEPSAHVMTERKAGFPLLSLSREGTATVEEYTLEKDKLTQQWTLCYVLSPLDVLDKRKLGDMMSAVPKVVALAIKQRGHASYSSSLQFFDHFASIRMTGSQVGNVQFAENSPIFWHICEMTLETVEITGYRDGAFGIAEAVDYTIGVGGDEGVQPSLVLGSSDQDPES